MGIIKTIWSTDGGFICRWGDRYSSKLGLNTTVKLNQSDCRKFHILSTHRKSSPKVQKPEVTLISPRPYFLSTWNTGWWISLILEKSSGLFSKIPENKNWRSIKSGQMCLIIWKVPLQTSRKTMKFISVIFLTPNCKTVKVHLWKKSIENQFIGNMQQYEKSLTMRFFHKMRFFLQWRT